MSPELYNKIRSALLRSTAFESNEGVRNLFTRPYLQPWRHSVSEAGSQSGRVDAAIARLFDRKDVEGRSALGLLLLVVSETESGQLAAELRELALAVDPNMPQPEDGETPPPPTSPEIYRNFRLHVAPGGHVTAYSDEGQRSAQINIEPPAPITEIVALLENHAAGGDQLRQLGQALYGWLFPEPIHVHFNQTEAVARANGENIRLRLHVEPATIARLPLEFLYRSEGDRFFATDPKTVLSRYLNVPLPPGRVRRREGALHLLLIVSEPTGVEPLDAGSWETELQKALAHPLQEGLLTLDTVKVATRRQIRDALYRREPDIVQFVGHGVYRAERQEAAIALVDEDTNGIWAVNERQFRSLFSGFDDSLGLIGLAACESAQSNNPQGFRGLAPRLQQEGIPAVLAMQYKVQVRTARLFLEAFYTAVAARKPVDWSTQIARNEIAIVRGEDNREFATPVLYMRADDGQIFG